MKKLSVLLMLISIGLVLDGNVRTAVGQARFSSVYTKNIDKCGSGWTRKEEKEAENRGQDVPVECKGVGGYTLNIGYSCCATYFSVNRGADSINLFTESLGWKQQSAEWRLADGKPFAVIIRYNTYKFDEKTQLPGDVVTGEFLKIKGLFGFERIDGDVDARKTKNPNAEARRIADEGFQSKK